MTGMIYSLRERYRNIGVAAIAVFAIMTGIVIMRVSWRQSAKPNWLPVELSLPAARTATRAAFVIASPGRFDLEVVTKMDAASNVLRRQETAVRWRASFAIDGPCNFAVARKVGEWAPEFSTSDSLAYSGEILNLPVSGRYTMTIRTEQDRWPGGNSIPILRLYRLEPAGYGLKYVVLTVAASLCVGGGLFALGIVLLSLWRRRRERTPVSKNV